MNAYKGMHTALILMKPQASSFTLSSELYNSGNTPASMKSTIPSSKLDPTENVISFVSVSLASSSSPAPKSCPTRIATALPIAINTTLNRLLKVEAIFSPATASSPRLE